MHDVGISQISIIDVVVAARLEESEKTGYMRMPRRSSALRLTYLKLSKS